MVGFPYCTSPLHPTPRVGAPPFLGVIHGKLGLGKAE